MAEPHKKPDPDEGALLEALKNAPVDDEPETDEERRLVHEAKADPRRLSTVELCAELGIDLDAADC